MALLPRLLGGRTAGKGTSLTIDYSKAPSLPVGAVEVLWHIPAGQGVMNILPRQLKIEPMPRGVTYLEYRENNSQTVFADELVLTALMEALVDKDGYFDQNAIKTFLGDFHGQIFFLSTAYKATGSEIPHFRFLNWKTHFPAHTYICPGNNPINHDVNCCACSIEMQPALIK